MQSSIFLALVLLPTMALADPYSIGGKKIFVPKPTGFARVLKTMPKVQELTSAAVPSTNLELASFIVEDDVPVAIAGGIPRLARRLSLQTSKRALRGFPLHAFERLKEEARKASLDAYDERIRREIDRLSEGVTAAFDEEIALSIAGDIMLPVHFESERSISFSVISRWERKDESGGQVSALIVSTTSIVVVHGRLLFLYVFGGEKDLQWTRAVSREWANAVLAANLDEPALPGHQNSFE